MDQRDRPGRAFRAQRGILRFLEGVSVRHLLNAGGGKFVFYFYPACMSNKDHKPFTADVCEMECSVRLWEFLCANLTFSKKDQLRKQQQNT